MKKCIVHISKYSAPHIYLMFHPIYSLRSSSLQWVLVYEFTKFPCTHAHTMKICMKCLLYLKKNIPNTVQNTNYSLCIASADKCIYTITCGTHCFFSKFILPNCIAATVPQMFTRVQCCLHMHSVQWCLKKG